MEGPCCQKNGVAEEHMTYPKTETSTRGKKTKEEEPIATRKGFAEKRTAISDSFNELSITERSTNFPNDHHCHLYKIPPIISVYLFQVIGMYVRP